MHLELTSFETLFIAHQSCEKRKAVVHSSVLQQLNIMISLFSCHFGSSNKDELSILSQTTNMDSPDVCVLNAFIRQVCRSKSALLFLSELLEVQGFILTTWDIGAKRTFWRYYIGDERTAQWFLLHYYTTYFVNNNWTCKNPSAAAVHTMRWVWFDSDR